MSEFPNYWKQHPVMALAFDKKWVDDPKSSDIMHCISMFRDPRSDLAMEDNKEVRLSYIRKKFPKFNPEDPNIKSVTDIYVSLIPELDIQFERLLHSMKKRVDYIVNEEFKDIKEADIQVGIHLKSFSAFEQAAMVRKKLAESRAENEVVGVSGYPLSWAETGQLGR